MKKITQILIITFVTLLLLSCSKSPVLTVHGQTMGTWYTVKVYGVESESATEKLQSAIDAALSKINTSVNRYNPESEISHFNTSLDNTVFPVSDDFMRVARVSEKIYKESKGTFDPTVKRLVELWGFGDHGLETMPSKNELEDVLKHVGFEKLQLTEKGISKKDPLTQLDFSAIAKGYGVDLVLEEVQALGYENILVEIGGDIRVKGRNGNKAWRIGIALPSDDNIRNENISESVELREMACATSGDYQQFYIKNGERFTHLIDPKTGYPIRHEVTSVTVLAENCMLADACATAAIVLGLDKGLEFIDSIEGVEAYFIYRDRDEMRSKKSSKWEELLGSRE